MRTRAASDDALASALHSCGLPVFLDHWYSTPMWSSLRNSPAFGRLVGRRADADEGAEWRLAAVLRAASPGRTVRGHAWGAAAG